MTQVENLASSLIGRIIYYSDSIGKYGYHIVITSVIVGEDKIRFVGVGETHSNETMTLPLRLFRELIEEGVVYQSCTTETLSVRQKWYLD